MRPVKDAVCVGIEHEYRLLNADQSADFRDLVHELGLGCRGLDPADPNAYRLSSGEVVTADGAEAEIALPPIPIQEGFEAAAAVAAANAREDLAARLPGVSLQGYSTHISVTVPTTLIDDVARLYCATFAPSMMLLLDKHSSPGLLVRPRPGRLELGGEYLDGATLAVAVAFAVGSVLTCCDVVRRRSTLGIQRVSVDPLPDDHRYGWFVSRYAFGGDLYRERRSTRLTTEDGGTVLAQEHLAKSWHAASERLGLHLDPRVGRLVVGDMPLPSEGDLDEALQPRSTPSVNPFGDVLRHRIRDGFDLAPVMATWDTTVLLALQHSTRRRLFINVPRDALESFLIDLDSGALDPWLRRQLSGRPRRRRLRHHSQTRSVGVYGQLGPRRNLLAPERAPVSVQQQGNRRSRRRTTWGIAASLPRW